MSKGQLVVDHSQVGEVIYTLSEHNKVARGVLSGDVAPLAAVARLEDIPTYLFLEDGRTILIKITHANSMRALFFMIAEVTFMEPRGTRWSQRGGAPPPAAEEDERLG